jgi:hypothetical protein
MAQSPIVAAQGTDQPFELESDEGETRLQLHGVYRVAGLFDLQVDGDLI